MTAACPTPLKAAYSTRKRALNAIGRRGGTLPLYAYKCRCHAWHMTRSAPSQKRALP